MVVPAAPQKVSFISVHHAEIFGIGKQCFPKMERYFTRGLLQGQDAVGESQIGFGCVDFFCSQTGEVKNTVAEHALAPDSINLFSDGDFKRGAVLDAGIPRRKRHLGRGGDGLGIASSRCGFGPRDVREQ